MLFCFLPLKQWFSTGASQHLGTPSVVLWGNWPGKIASCTPPKLGLFNRPKAISKAPFYHTALSGLSSPMLLWKQSWVELPGAALEVLDQQEQHCTKQLLPAFGSSLMECGHKALHFLVWLCSKSSFRQFYSSSWKQTTTEKHSGKPKQHQQWFSARGATAFQNVVVGCPDPERVENHCSEAFNV